MFRLVLGRRLLQCAWLCLAACGSPEPHEPAPPPPAIAAPEAPVEAPAFDAVLAPGDVGIEVCTLETRLGVEAADRAVGGIVRRGDGSLVALTDERVVILRPIASRDCRFAVRALEHPGLRASHARVVADRALGDTAWVAHAGALFSVRGEVAEAPVSLRAVDGLLARDGGGVWACTDGRCEAMGTTAAAEALTVDDGTPLASIDGALVVARSADVAVRRGDAPPVVLAEGTFDLAGRGSDGAWLLAASGPTASILVRSEGAPPREVGVGGAVDFALGLAGDVSDGPAELTGLTDAVAGVAFALVEVASGDVREAIVVRVRGL